MESKDPLKFEDTKNTKTDYFSPKKKQALKMLLLQALVKSRQTLVVACMNFNFIGGSMGAVVGEKSVEPYNMLLNKIVVL